MATLVWLPKNYSGVTNLKSKGQKELDEYIFTRKDVAKLLGISPNAVRHRMRRGATTLEYRFDGSKFLFKRPGDNELRGHPLATPKSHEKALRDHDRSVQKRLFPKRYNRGSTHEEHGGKPSKGGTYTQPSFKYHNEMKMLNSLQNKYQNPAQRREFENLNEEALKEADKRAKKKAEITVPLNHMPGDKINLRRLKGEMPHYGNMLYRDGLKEVERREQERLDNRWTRENTYSQNLMGHDYWRPFAKDEGSYFLNSAYDPANMNNEEHVAEIDIDRVEAKSIVDETPDFSESIHPKVSEAIWRAKRGDKK